MVPFQKRVKNPQQKWYHLKKGSKILNKNGTISEKGQKSSTKWYHFRKWSKFSTKWYHFRQLRVKIPEQKWYHFRKGSKILNKNGTISKKGQNSSTKMVPFQAVKGQNSLTKMVPFQKRVKNPQRKWYHFRKKLIT